ncbi:MAG: tRNA lysidine(34) synthetase TilS [Firmicutes bacterium]|nr:tRNA lysidine(34) synthetase TilS [Bacillota bacterium]
MLLDLNGFNKGAKIGVAVSGGADSMVLLDLLTKSGLNITAINVEHGLRGEASLKDSEFVKNYCKENKIKCLCYSVEAGEFAEREGVSEELSARVLRYKIFDELLFYKSVDYIALAHHKNDQAETVLMRLIRGGGARGLRGIVNREGYIHPLLNYSKKEILDYAEKNGVPFVFDESNNDVRHFRNFIRLRIMPLIEERYQGASTAIARSAKLSEELEDYLLSEITPAILNGEVSLPLSVLNRHPYIAKKSVLEALRLAGAEQDIDYTHLEAVLRLKECENNAVINLSCGFDAIREYDKIVFVKRADKEAFLEDFSVNGEYIYCGKRFYFAPVIINKDFKPANEKGVFDFGKIPADSVIRARTAGDSFKKFKGGTKPLAEYLSDIKLTKRERSELLVVAKGHKIYNILGVEISDEIKVDSSTTNAYRVIIEDI